MTDAEWRTKGEMRRDGAKGVQAELAGLEAEAKELRYFLPAMITGLLATPDYVHASLEHVPGEVSETVARKLERQAVLQDATKKFTFLLTE